MNGFDASLVAWGSAGEPPAERLAAASANASTRGVATCSNAFSRPLENIP
jgi:hypothetical protein